MHRTIGEPMSRSQRTFVQAKIIDRLHARGLLYLFVAYVVVANIACTSESKNVPEEAGTSEERARTHMISGLDAFELSPQGKICLESITSESNSDDLWWTGRYRGMQQVLSVARQGGFLFTIMSDLGLRGEAWGSIDLDGEVLVLRLEEIVERGVGWSQRIREMLPERLVPIRCGDRAVLVREDRLTRFCRMLSRGEFPTRPSWDYFYKGQGVQMSDCEPRTVQGRDPREL